MDVVEQVRNHPFYQQMYDRLQQYERERVFCRHDMAHFLDVARIAYIVNLEQHLGLRKEVIYSAALLHDMGRVRQYADGMHHDEAGADFAEHLFSCMAGLGLTQAEQQDIIQAVRGHRRQGSNQESLLGKVLRESDKKSRRCFQCAARPDCNWPDEKKNLIIDI